VLWFLICVVLSWWWLQRVKRLYPLDEHMAFEQTLKVLTVFMLTAGTLVMGLYWYIMDITKAQMQAAMTKVPSTSTGGGEGEAVTELEWRDTYLVCHKRVITIVGT
jgi:hypothetical protein